MGGDTCARDTNVWIVGDERECAIIDPAGDVAVIRELVGERKVLAILCTHAHDSHIGAAAALGDETHALIFLHGDDYPLWIAQFPGRNPDVQVVRGMSLLVGGARLQALHTPGHTPGGTCWYSPDLGVVFTGDTLLKDGPGRAVHVYSDYEALISSIRRQLFMLPGDTVVHPGHGEDTRIASQRWDMEFWGTTTQRRPDSSR